MTKRLLPCLMCLILCLSSISHAQNPNPNWESVKFPKVIFTEYCGSKPSQSYFEITNTEDTTVDLSSFRIDAGHYVDYLEFNPEERWFTKSFWRGTIDLAGHTLKSGESMVFANVYDKAINANNPTIPSTNFNFVPYIDWPIFKKDVTTPEIPFMDQPKFLTFDFDSITPDEKEGLLIEPGNGLCSYGLWYRYEHLDTLGIPVTDSLMADVVNLWVNPGTLEAGWASNVAGTEEATKTHTLVRKYNSYPSADWGVSRGVSSEDSQWMLVPNPLGRLVYTTVGNHGDYPISLKAKANTTAKVDDAKKIISVPWEAVRGDSVLVNFLEFGDGMAWEYFKDSIDNEDSAYVRVRDGDILKVYAFGTGLRTETYTFKSLEATPDLALARSKVPFYNDAYGNWGYFTVTTNELVMDSIVNIKNQLRIDTLMKYIEIPPLAQKQLIYKDNNSDRIDLIDGDILRVTSENKKVVKDYYLQVEDYVLSDNSNLSSITWPDFNKDDFFQWDYLRQDTLPEFMPNKYNYTLMLPGDYINVPALFATTEDLNAQLVIERATNLKGTAQERTTTFRIKSESDTLESTYSVVFELDLGNELQTTNAHPFISEHLGLRWGGDDYMELYNPNNGTELLDMSHYMLVRSYRHYSIDGCINYTPSSPVDVNNQAFYIPGYKFNYNKGDSENYDDWTWKDGIVGSITPDANVNAFVAPGDVFVIGNWDPNSDAESDINGTPTADIADLNLRENPDYPNVVRMQCVTAYNFPKAYYFYEILNDSILNGTKGIWENSDDYRIIDVMSILNTSTIAGHTCMSQSLLIRKPEIQKGNINVGPEGALHTDIDTCEYLHYGSLAQVPEEFKLNAIEKGQYIGYHVMNPITSHMSTVTSNAYKVDLGYQGDLKIKGDMPNVTVADFIANLNKSDSAQSISIERSEVALSSDDIVTTNDIVVVRSADSINTTKYTIEASALNSDVNLTSVSDLGIIVNNEKLTISGFSYDIAIADVLAGVSCHELSLINVIDTNNNLVPLLTRSRDTSLVEPIVATNVFNGIYLEVIAEDGTTAKYAVTPEALSSEAYVTSNVFTINQEENNRYISGVSGGYSVSTFLDLLNPSGNATVKLKNKLGVQRTYGDIQLDDYVAVISEDQSITTKYAINFNGEAEPDVLNKLKGQNTTSLIKLFPNPTSSVLNIKNAKTGSIVQLISLNGSMVYTKLLNNDHCTIDMSQMNSGVYIVRLVEKEGTSVFRVLKN